MAASKGPSKKKAKQAKAAASKLAAPKKPGQPRTIKKQHYRSFRLHKKIKTPKSKQLPTARELIRSSWRLARKHQRLHAGVLAVVLLLNAVFAYGIGTLFTDGRALVDTINELFGGELNGGELSLATMSALFGTFVPSSDAGAVYQSIVTVLSLSWVIWMVRQLRAKATPGLGDVVYGSTGQLIPLLLVLFVMGLQLLPALFGLLIYSVVVAGGVAVFAYEQIIWSLLAILLVVLSVYMLCSSVFAMIIVTLPDVRPMQALRSARELVKHRRVSVAWRLFAVSALLLLVVFFILWPMIILLPVIAPISYYVLSTGAALLAVSCLYQLYRSLL